MILVCGSSSVNSEHLHQTITKRTTLKRSETYQTHNTPPNKEKTMRQSWHLQMCNDNNNAFRRRRRRKKTHFIERSSFGRTEWVEPSFRKLGRCSSFLNTDSILYITIADEISGGLNTTNINDKRSTPTKMEITKTTTTKQKWTKKCRLIELKTPWNIQCFCKF